MTRSAAKRANRNARVIAKGIQYGDYVALDESTAQRLASRLSQRSGADAWNLDEVNWPYAAELMNRAARLFYGGV